MSKRTIVMSAALLGASGVTLAVRKALRSLDAADAEYGEPVFAFPSGRVVSVATSDGATIFTETVGSGPAVVLVHGITSSRQDWGPVARLLLEQGYTVVGVDQRGHGDSNVGSQGYSAARFGKDLAEVVTGLDLKDATIVGHSMGGIAAMTFALDHPEVCSSRVTRLVLVATTPRAPRPLPGRTPGLVETAMGLTRFDPAVARPATAQALFGRFGSSGLLRAARASGLRADPAQVGRCAAGLSGYDITSRLSSIRANTRCIYGTRDVVTPPRANRAIADAVPGASRREIKGAGHLLIWTHAPDVVEEVAQNEGPAPSWGGCGKL